MIPFGHWRPDIAGINTKACHRAVGVLPAPNGFRPAPSLLAFSTNALEDVCLGAATVLDASGGVHAFAGTTAKLYKINTTGAWANVSRTSGGAYAVGANEQWRFESFGDLIIAGNIATDPQKFTLGVSSNFTALGGTPPRARDIAIVRDFVVLGGITAAEDTVRWSGINNAEHWTAGTQSAGSQRLPNGGPVRRVVGGEVGYVFQALEITRMNFTGDAAIFAFDKVEGGRGLAAPWSLVRAGRTAYYLGSDAFYRFDLGGGVSEPIGVGKWERQVRNDIKPGTEVAVIGAVDPVQRVILWSYVPKSSVSPLPSRMVVYDWSIDEATTIDLPVYALSQWLTHGISLDSLDPFGTLETLPFALDSPAWQGGASALAVFSTDNKLSYMTGPPQAAEIVTSDGQKPGRHFIAGTRPAIDTGEALVALASRERDGDAIAYMPAEAMEDTGINPAHLSGNIVRGRITVPAGAAWSLFEGLETLSGKRGRR